MDISVIAIVCGVSGVIAGMIAYSKAGNAASFVVFFFFGAILPLLGIVAALLIKTPRPAPLAPGWYADPWTPGQVRWHDGSDWTGHVNPALQA